MSTYHRIASLLKLIKNNATNRQEWIDNWVSFTDDWAEDTQTLDNLDNPHVILEGLLTACEAWDYEEDFIGKLWDLADATCLWSV